MMGFYQQGEKKTCKILLEVSLCHILWLLFFSFSSPCNLFLFPIPWITDPILGYIAWCALNIKVWLVMGHLFLWLLSPVFTAFFFIIWKICCWAPTIFLMKKKTTKANEFLCWFKHMSPQGVRIYSFFFLERRSCSSHCI